MTNVEGEHTDDGLREILLNPKSVPKRDRGNVAGPITISRGSEKVIWEKKR